MRNPRRGRIAVLLVLALLGVMTAAVRPGPAAAAPSQSLALLIDSEAGETIGNGVTEEFTPPSSVITASGSNGASTTFTMSVGGPPCPASACEYVVTLTPPSGTMAWAEQVYENAQKTADSTHPGLNVSSADGGVCDTTNGRFTVDEVEVGLLNVITKFVAHFEQHCNGDTEALFGAVWFQGTSTTPWYSRDVAPDPLNFDKVSIGTGSTKSITLTRRTGASPMSPDNFEITGTDESAFTIDSETCTATSSFTDCTVNVKFTPLAQGGYVALLNWDDELAPLGPPGGVATTGTGRSVLLTGTGVLSRLTVTGNGLFGDSRVGLFTDEHTIRLTNTGTEPVDLGALTIEGADASAFAMSHECEDVTLVSGNTCEVLVVAYPNRITENPLASLAATLHIADDAANGPHAVALRVNGVSGYWLAEIDGTVHEFGDAEHLGDMNDFDFELNAPMLGITSTSTGDGYWMVGSDGGIFSFGDAAFHGSTGSIPLNQPVLDMDAAVDDSGYWLVALDGGVFAFDVPFHGSMGGKPLNKPVVGIATTPAGGGYWLVATDGGVFAFGDAPFKGSTGSLELVAPIVGLAATADGQGYWMVAADGGVFAFGTAGFYGSAAGTADDDVVAIEPSPTGKGYWILQADGTVFPFGDAFDYGGLDPEAEALPVLGIAGSSPPVNPAGAAAFYS